MRTAVLIILILSSAAAVADDTSYENAKEKSAEAIDAQKKYVFAQKEEFVKQLNSQITKANQEILDLQKKMKSATGSARKEGEERIEKLNSLVDKSNIELGDVKKSTQSKWSDLESEAEDSMQKLKAGVRSTRQWMSEKIAP